MGFRYGMRDWNELDLERPEIDAAARGYHRDRNLRRVALGGAFGLEQRRTEFRRIDRALQAGPKVDDGAEVIFMGMRQHEPDQVLPFLLEKADVGHDRLDARQMLLVAKGHSEIDGKPKPPGAIAEAVDRQVHADLADATERRECQFVHLFHQAAPADAAEPK